MCGDDVCVCACDQALPVALLGFAVWLLFFPAMAKLKCDFSVGVAQLQRPLHLFLEAEKAANRSILLSQALKKLPMVTGINFTEFTYFISKIWLCHVMTEYVHQTYNIKTLHTLDTWHIQTLIFMYEG
jgi:hypothetical protein